MIKLERILACVLVSLSLTTVATAQCDLLPRSLMLDSLSKAHSCSVEIPAELEPDATMNFYLGVKGEKPEGGYPVIIYLHGSGPRQAEWAAGLRLALSFDDAPSMYVIPQIPNEGGWYRWWQRGKQWVWSRLLNQLLSMDEVDPRRIYIIGISEGGYGSQRLASFLADYLAGAGPMAGGEPLKNAPVENLGHTAFSFQTGELDNMFGRNMLTRETSARLDSMQRIYPDEYPHRVVIQSGRGHGIDYSPTTPWLMTHTREAQPHHFVWENMEMDGIKRNAFYNIEVIEESSGEDRTLYEFSIGRKNRIDLNVNTVRYTTAWRDPRWGIEMLFDKSLSPAEHGQLRIYLSDQLIDTEAPVTLRINGKRVFHSRAKACEDCANRAWSLWHDPLRRFDRSIEVSW